jgi:hypothetical protein
MLPNEKMLVELRYWARVWIVARALALGWSKSGPAFVNAWESAVELWSDLWRLAMFLLLPLTFWAAPLWLWGLERDNRMRKAARIKAEEEMFANRRTTTGQQP